MAEPTSAADNQILKPHSNAIVPHKIANHDTEAVQLNVWNGTEWVNIYDGNDMRNMNIDLHKVSKVVEKHAAEIPAVESAANSAVEQAESAVSASKVNSEAIAAQSEAISEAKSAINSAAAEIQQTAANAASDAAKIRVDVAQVQSEIDANKAANSASVEALRSDVSAAKQDLADVHDSLTKAQAAAEESQKAIDKSIAQINSDIEQDRKDITSAQQANADTAKQLDTYSKQAQDQGKTIKSIQDKQDGFTATLADVQGNVTQVSDKVDGLSASLKDAQDNVASVKAQADQLSATLTDHAKSIATLTASAKELSSTLEDADGRLSKVEQTASEQSTTLSDLQGNLTQVRQTADGLVTTLKDTQGNIDQIKQDAKGTLEQLSNVQGDITALQKDVSGIKLTIADHDKNIHTLQADSKTLKDDMTDAKGNISSLQKTSTSLVSEFRDHDDRLSKVEQTATEHTSELADTKGNLDKVTQKANNLQLLLSDAQKNINNIKVDAQGLHQALTGQSNQLANLNVTLNNLDSKYSGITGDLQSKQTALSTEQKQTKDMLLNKADKSEVDNVKGTVNQVSAEQKTMAGQISQKVSSSEYQTLKDKVNNLRIGGRNLIPNSGTDIVIESKTTDAYPQWDNHLLYSSLQSNTTYTFSVSATNTNGVEQASVRIFKSSLDGKYLNKEAAHWYFNADGKRHNFTFTTPNDAIPYDIWLYAGPMGTLQGKNFVTTYHHPQLELGNIESDYSPNPDDAIASIKKNSTAIDENSKLISLKADQTEVDNVKSTAQQNSSRLDVMAGEIKSKVTSTDVNNIVDGKGYATTSTVRSLIDQKSNTISESIVKLSNDVRNNGGGINLLRSTDAFSKAYWIYDNIENRYKDSLVELEKVGTTASRMYQSLSVEATEHVFSVSFDAQISDDCTDTDVIVSCGPYDALQNIRVTGKDLKHYKVENWTWASTSNNFSLYVGNGKIRLSKLKLEYGPVATPYAPAPSDNASVAQLQSVTASIDGLQSSVTNYQNDTTSKYTQLSNLMQSKVGTADFKQLKRSVDMQTLDSADINNMKTNGHYFVHNLANNPVGGWVYVDVTGNGNDRIRQDVYQDSGNKHKYRRWFGNSWTNWSEGATESEITQLRDDINLRVKSGDLLSQINIEAGRTLIQSNKIYFDADSFVMSPNSKAFIPSAFITDLSADKITTGTLDASKLHVKNFSADNITGGTLTGINIRTDNHEGQTFELSGATQTWKNGDNIATLGQGIIHSDNNFVDVSDKDFSIVSDTSKIVLANGWLDKTTNKMATSSLFPQLVLNFHSFDNNSWNPDRDQYSFGVQPGGQGASFRMYQSPEDSSDGPMNYDSVCFTCKHNFTIELASDPKLNREPTPGQYHSELRIHRDNCIGAYFGEGKNGNQINFSFGNSDGGLNVNGPLHVSGSKNSVVQTSQGWLAINAYETAEYYFGDIGESNTGDTGRITIGIDRIFNETVNTNVQYQVFVTPYSDAHIWVEQRYHNRFIICSDKPNAEFGWEIKAKRKGYEDHRLRKVNADFKPLSVLNKGDF